MSALDVDLAGDGECEVVHRESGERIRTAMAPESGGEALGFSPMDLLAAALGSCIASSLEPVARRHGMSPGTVHVTVNKQLEAGRRRVRVLDVEVRLDGTIPGEVIKRLERAARQCVVHRALAPDIGQAIRFIAPRS